MTVPPNAAIAATLKPAHEIDLHLDAIDPGLKATGEDLTGDVRRQLGTCVQLDLYAGVSGPAEQTDVRQKSAMLSESVAKASGTQEVYRSLWPSVSQGRR